MKPKKHFLTQICVPLLFLTLTCAAQDEAAKKLELVGGPGYVSYSLGKAPKNNEHNRQELSLYGCNQEVTTKTTFWNDSINLQWNTPNQLLQGVPFGWQKEGSNDTAYYISKYYQASPPVFPKGFDGTQAVTIGLVIPDRFTFFGEAPVQKVFLDYEILEPVYLNMLHVNYDFVNKEGNTCGGLGANLIPLNIECKDFRWNDLNGIKGAKGASGIARIKNDSVKNRQVFLPSYQPKGEECLDCTLTILDDIMLHHDVLFIVDGKPTKTINMTDFYKAHVYKKQKGDTSKIDLSCTLRTTPPPGCQPTQN